MGSRSRQLLSRHRRANASSSSSSSAAAAVGSPAFKVSRSEYKGTFDAATYTPASYDFWLDVARSEIEWFEEPTRALEGRVQGVQVENRWFPDGTTNLCLNALDRHVEAGHGDRTAIAYHSTVGGNSRLITYKEMLDDVASFAGSLEALGVTAGDRVLLYMPMIPEAAVAMLACTRIGAVHSVVFGGFAAPELAVRIDDAEPKVVIAATCGLEGAKGALPYMPAVNQAIDLASHQVPSVVIVQRDEEAAAGVEYELRPQRDHDFKSMVDDASTRADCVALSASAPLYTIYTSGTTGDPKGILRDNSHAVTLKWSMTACECSYCWSFLFLSVCPGSVSLLLLRPCLLYSHPVCPACLLPMLAGNTDYGTAPGETFFAASDIGWVVGHSYIVYAPLLHGCTSVMFEGKPVGTPDAGTYWRIIEKYKVANMFTAPTALRAIRKFDPTGELMSQHDISSMRTMFVAGERADPDTVAHYEELLNVPVVDHWWQTESGSPMCGVQLDDVGTTLGSCSLPLPGYDMCVLDPESGEELSDGEMGAIAIKMPLPPGFMTTLYNNDARYEEAYLSEFPGYYSAGDAGFRDENGCASHPAQSLVMMMLLLALIKSAASDLDLLVSATNPI
jgi:propionyl-CoA synthetase